MLLGVLLMVVSHRAILFVTPKDPFRGLVIVGVMMGARFCLALASLTLFAVFAPSGLAPFGILLAISFVVGLFIEAVPSSGSRAMSTST